METKYVDASELGLAPGHWPMTVQYDRKVWKKLRPRYADGNELFGYWYEHFGEMLFVGND